MKRAEGVLADVFDHSAIGLAIFDDRLRYRALNSGLAAMHGMPVEFHFGKSLREILGPVASSVEPAVKQVLTTGRPILNLEITGELPARAGRRRWGRSPLSTEGRNWQCKTGRRGRSRTRGGRKAATKGQLET